MDVEQDGVWTQYLQPSPLFRDTDIVRASERQHPVQGSRGEGNLGRLGLVCARPKRIAYHALVAPDRCLDLGPQIVAAGFLPGHAAAFGDHPQTVITLCWSGFSRGARHRARPRRHDDGGIRMTLGNRLADPVLVVVAVDSKGDDRIGDPCNNMAALRIGAWSLDAFPRKMRKVE